MMELIPVLPTSSVAVWEGAFGKPIYDPLYVRASESAVECRSCRQPDGTRFFLPTIVLETDFHTDQQSW